MMIFATSSISHDAPEQAAAKKKSPITFNSWKYKHGYKLLWSRSKIIVVWARISQLFTLFSATKVISN